jgi:hypothetical protein
MIFIIYAPTVCPSVNIASKSENNLPLRMHEQLYVDKIKVHIQIRGPGFHSRHYQEKKAVGLERGLLGLVSTTEELFDRKVAAPV